MGIERNYYPTVIIILIGAFIGSLTQTSLATALPKLVADLNRQGDRNVGSFIGYTGSISVPWYFDIITAFIPK